MVDANGGTRPRRRSDHALAELNLRADAEVAEIVWVASTSRSTSPAWLADNRMRIRVVGARLTTQPLHLATGSKSALRDATEMDTPLVRNEATSSSRVIAHRRGRSGQSILPDNSNGLRVLDASAGRSQ
jgi:hypothetical protein